MLLFFAWYRIFSKLVLTFIALVVLLMKSRMNSLCLENGSVGQGWGGCREGPVRPSQLRAGAPPACSSCQDLNTFKSALNLKRPVVFKPEAYKAIDGGFSDGRGGGACVGRGGFVEVPAAARYACAQIQAVMFLEYELPADAY